jgi:lysophospholipase L1-like esterase
MMGVNDVDTGETLVPTRLGHLMDSILAADPKLLLVVARIIPQRGPPGSLMNRRVRVLNAAIPGLVKARAEAGKHVVMVDMHAAFTAHPNVSAANLADRLHPSPAGYAVMADAWYAAIEPFLASPQSR